tara:strand:- start:293 stop:601 length:309 start_codon:yes stop_codon:yes gene_type:complete
MAITVTAGDISYDSGMPLRSGNRFVVHGILGANATKAAFAITSTKSTLTSASLTAGDNAASNQEDTAVQGIINQNAGGTATNGTIAVDAGIATDVRFRIEYV